MIDNDKLLRDFGDPVRDIYVRDGIGYVDIKHAIPVGKRNVKLINVRQTFDPRELGSKLNAIETATDNYNKIRWK